jgi:hypothetical protein
MIAVRQMNVRKNRCAAGQLQSVVIAGVLIDWCGGTGVLKLVSSLTDSNDWRLSKQFKRLITQVRSARIAVFAQQILR